MPNVAEQIRDNLQAMIPMRGGVFEVRALNVPEGRYVHNTVSGYYDDLDRAAEDVAKIDGKATGIYWTPNIVDPDLLSRAYNRMRPIRKEPTTSDHNVVELAYLLVDFDAVRAADISSTAEEHQAAIDMAWKVFFGLQDEGWPDPFVADSGNGAHLMYRISPATVVASDDGRRFSTPMEDAPLIQRCLAALAARHDNDKVKVDQTTFNPARVWKLYGTMVRKGDNTPQRPHRRCEMLLIPDLDAPLVTREQLEALARTAPVEELAPQTQRGSYQGQPFDINGFIAKHGLDLKAPRPYGSGRKWIFRACPWNTDHRDNSAFLIQFSGGAISAGCHHNGCSGKTWPDLRMLYEPNAYQRQARPQQLYQQPARLQQGVRYDDVDETHLLR